MDQATRVQDVVQACKALAGGGATLRFWEADDLADFLATMGGTTTRTKRYDERQDRLVESVLVELTQDGIDIRAHRKNRIL